MFDRFWLGHELNLPLLIVFCAEFCVLNIELNLIRIELGNFTTSVGGRVGGIPGLTELALFLAGVLLLFSSVGCFGAGTFGLPELTLSLYFVFTLVLLDL